MTLRDFYQTQSCFSLLNTVLFKFWSHLDVIGPAKYNIWYRPWSHPSEYPHISTRTRDGWNKKEVFANFIFSQILLVMRISYYGTCFMFHCSFLSWFVQRAGADDKPLRMVKTVLHELVKLRGTAIKGHLSMVPIDMQPQPIILAYIDLNLQVCMPYCLLKCFFMLLVLTQVALELNWTDTGSCQNVDTNGPCWANSLERFYCKQPSTCNALCRCPVEGIFSS